MSGNRSSSDASGESLVVDIVDVLEEQGRPRESYQLGNYVDPDALDRLVDSIEGQFTVSFTVDTFQITVSEEGVTARRRE